MSSPVSPSSSVGQSVQSERFSQSGLLSRSVRLSHSGRSSSPVGTSCPARGADVPQLTSEDYENLLAFRTGLRRLLHWSQTQARAVGLTPAQHQLLLAIKGHPGAQGPTVSDLAGYLLLRHHSAVELIDRAEAAGLVQRGGDEQDGRITRIRLTADSETRLTRLAPAHLDELKNLAPILDQLVAQWSSRPDR